MNRSVEYSPVCFKEEVPYDSEIRNSSQKRLVSFKNFKFNPNSQKARIDLNASALPEEDLAQNYNELQERADNNIKRNMLDRVDNKQDY